MTIVLDMRVMYGAAKDGWPMRIAGTNDDARQWLKDRGYDRTFKTEQELGPVLHAAKTAGFTVER